MSTPSYGGSGINLLRTSPVLDYTSADYESLLADMIRWAQAEYSTEGWTDFNPGQFAVVLYEGVAYAGDLLTFYMNTATRETMLSMAQRRSSVVEAAKGIGYTPRSASQASAELTVQSNAGLLPYTLPATAKFSSGDRVWQPDRDYTITLGTDYIDVLEGEKYAAVAIGTGTGVRGQRATLAHSPIVMSTLVVSVNGTAWEQVTSFALSSPSDTHYTAAVDDEDGVTVVFGDGVAGKAPPVGQAITASYTVGGGSAGRVASGAIDQIVTAPAAVLSVTNADASSGGLNEETTEQIRVAAPAALHAGDRAVSLQDYASLALLASGSVAKAAAIQQDARTIRVVIAPTGGGVATDSLKNTVASYLSSRRVVGHRVVMADPAYVPVRIEADLFLYPQANATTVVTKAKALFITPSASEAQNGVLDFDNATFAARLSDGSPLLSRDAVETMLRTRLQSLGVQRARLLRLCTAPYLRPVGFVSSTDAALTVTENEAEEIVRRQWTIVFTSGSAFNVYEGHTGRSTQLTRTTLTDDRARFQSLSGVTSPEINPNTERGTFLSVNAALSTAQAIRLQDTTADLYAYALTGDAYSVRWVASPATGTVGVAYTPTKQDGTSDPHGLSFTITGTGFSLGDTYVIDVFEKVDDAVVLWPDEIPTLDAADITINTRSAY